ncbi:hypothetical protein SteCoe_36860 [Stentor coeruleus]|uniref:Uncharacterized protein n=1 Tax=Stentor coeruleus TaxID=5963 RepID=A0A1R2AP68_9CILI|nr:hypothetical protein SteCoe_36860 [Stentor coeruleus]
MGAKKKDNLLSKPDKEKISKTPQPIQEKSTTNTKTKIESDSFHLWIPAPLENLEVLISSRKRVLETLDIKSENINTEIKQNLLIRDQQINALNKIILNLRNDLKSKEEHYKQSDYEGKIANLRKELTELRKDKEHFEEKIEALKQEYETAKANWEDERDSLMLQQESLVEDQQGMTSRLASKDREIKLMNDDIIQISKIVHEMTGINQELHKKIEYLNEVSDEFMKKFLAAQSKAEIADEIEGKYRELLERANRNANALENVEKKVYKDVEILVGMMSELDEIMMINSEKSSGSQKYYKILDFIENMKNFPQKSSNSEPLFLSPQYENIENKEKVLQIKISDLTTSLEKHKKEASLTINSLKKMTDTFKNYNSELVEKNSGLLSEIEKKDMEQQKLNTKVQHLTAKINVLSKKNKEITVKEIDYKMQIKDMQIKIDEMGEEQKSESNNINIREKRIKSVLGQIQVLRDEIFNKDTEILIKAKEIIKLEGFLEELKGQIQKINSKIKQSDAEMLKGVSKEIEAKDKQIVMLKEMLRSTNMEIKAKDSIIGHYKRKHESLNMSIN